MYDEYGDQVEFYVVYIREAHPTDDRPLAINETLDINYAQPKTYDDRKDIAAEMCHELKIRIPTLIDGLDNKTGDSYAAFPDRLYLVGSDGKISFKGSRGPFGFKPDELDKAIKKELGGERKAKDAVKRGPG